MQSINANVLFFTSERQLHLLRVSYNGVFEWIEFLSKTTDIDIFTSKNEVYDFKNNESVETSSKQTNHYLKNKDEYVEYSFNIYSHSGTKIWISEGGYDGLGGYYQYDGGSIATLYIKKDWKYREKFIKLLNESTNLWNQLELGWLDWISDLSDEEVVEMYNERFDYHDQEEHCSHCPVFKLTIDEMKEQLNEYEIEGYFYDYKYDKFNLEFIKEDLFGVENV